MLAIKILTLILSLFTALSQNKVLFHETLTITSLDVSQKELTDLIIQKYKIKNDYKKITISSEYFYNPNYNQIYSVTLEANYNDEIVIYNLKMKVINEQEKSETNNTTIIVILSSTAIITLIIYLTKRK